MDALIRTAWRAFWVGLGASAVLIGQSVVAPSASPAQPVPGDPALAPLVVPAPNVPTAPSAPAAARRQSNDPLSVHCTSLANGLRCS